MVSVVKDAVIEDELHISYEVMSSQVLVCCKFLLYCPKVHWLLHNVEVVRNIELHWVYWLKEDPCMLELTKAIHNSSGSFVPMIIDNHIVW